MDRPIVPHASAHSIFSDMSTACMIKGSWLASLHGSKDIEKRNRQEIKAVAKYLDSNDTC
jgi:hypothetical protein